MSAHAVNPGSAAGSVSVELRRLPGFRRLAADYADASGALLPFYGGHPSDPGAWRAAIERTLAFPRNRDALTELVGIQQRRRGAPAAAAAAAERLRLPGSVAVVTGQQAGLFGGPLLTLLKAVTAIRLARRIEANHGTPAVAVFWVEADDHDWEEVASCGVFDSEWQLRRIRAAPPPGAGVMSVGALRFTGEVTEAVEHLAAALPRTEFSTSVLDQLARAYAPGASPAEAFGQMLEQVLGDEGLVVFDASDRDAKPLSRGIFSREVRAPGRTAELAAEAGARLEAIGYQAQVTMRRESLAVFSLTGGRVPIRQEGGSFIVGDRPVSASDLLAAIDAEPGAFSPNVLLRPIVQDAIFPTAAYVAGPNELAYHAQLGRIYEHFGIPRPLVALRLSATLLEPSALRFLARHGIPFDALAAQDERLLNTLLESTLPQAVESALDAAAAAVDASMRHLADALPTLDPTLTGAATSSLGRMTHELRGLREKILHAAKRKDDVLKRQFSRTRAQAFPEGLPQERAAGWVSFVNRHGRGVVRRLIDDLPLEPVRHWIVTA